MANCLMLINKGNSLTYIYICNLYKVYMYNLTLCRPVNLNPHTHPQLSIFLHAYKLDRHYNRTLYLPFFLSLKTSFILVFLIKMLSIQIHISHKLNYIYIYIYIWIILCVYIYIYNYFSNSCHISHCNELWAIGILTYHILWEVVVKDKNCEFNYEPNIFLWIILYLYYFYNNFIINYYKFKFKFIFLSACNEIYI